MSLVFTFLYLCERLSQQQLLVAFSEWTDCLPSVLQHNSIERKENSSVLMQIMIVLLRQG
ncbi:Calmodulin-regulated spectrin-associated protein 3 [Frankliniella fusca]|uniref:Calmodulin-regulated spectrin-associated protein 3 n=1 Tax=Frankliniella fusca TaxID=407009 RepID=A0AAE1LJZ8_9NEOP|nr:Calmodulin-regulated spectrin-associated protein 3 [Frankliniella fusca]KAK3914699.1 Calmodulin-regulated spectrin-associated protein 3 [Frankliniella fusca]KAK3922008.1 Calmodulin-regulated spectrin-associated protein 3 [Frankliniella fusca]KAK3922075.1 Calmodulin-regulated spectrin-associated protein 3 [Frankliniella fusca]KAK3922533.1 Calmodulin-regulated spectrin-associated protein 3 [Frankliniella fusca]